MACEICQDERGGEARCPRCGYPSINAEGARALLEASTILTSSMPSGPEKLNRVIRKLQQAARADANSYIPHVRLATAYERKAQEGEPTLLRLADREINEALRLAPEEIEVHAARLSIAAKLGTLPVLRAEYEVRKAEKAFAAEALKMVDALEQAASFRTDGGIVGVEMSQRERWFKWAAIGAGSVGLLEMVIVIRSLNTPEYSLLSDIDFFLAVAFFTAAGILMLERRRYTGGKS